MTAFTAPSETLFSNDELTFLRRALSHFQSGKSVADSLQAVLEDDARLATAFFKRGTSQFFNTPDERGISRATGDQIGDVICHELAGQVYTALRATSVPA